MKRKMPAIPSYLVPSDKIISNDGRVSGLHCVSAVITQLTEAEVSGCIFERCRFTGCHAGNTVFSDVVFRGCELSGMDASNTGFVRCHFTDCKAQGLRAMDAYFHHVEWTSCKLEHSNFDGALFKNTIFCSSLLRETNFSHCKLENFQPENSDFTAASFFGTKLEKIDLRKAVVDGLIAEGRELQGAVVTPYQAANLAKLFGLVVKEEE